MTIRYLEPSLWEFEAAIRASEEQRPGRGDQFRKAVDQVIRRIEQFPESGAPVRSSWWQCIIPARSPVPGKIGFERNVA